MNRPAGLVTRAAPWNTAHSSSAVRAAAICKHASARMFRASNERITSQAPSAIPAMKPAINTAS